MDSGKRPLASIIDQMGITDKLKEKGAQISRSMFARPVQALSKMVEPVMIETFGAPPNMNQPGKDGSAPAFVSMDKLPSPKPWRPSHAAEIIFGNPSDKQRISGLAAGDLATDPERKYEGRTTKDEPPEEIDGLPWLEGKQPGRLSYYVTAQALVVDNLDLVLGMDKEIPVFDVNQSSKLSPAPSPREHMSGFDDIYYYSSLAEGDGTTILLDPNGQRRS